MKDSEVSSELILAKIECKDCYASRIERIAHGTVYVSPTPEQRAGSARLPLQQIIENSEDIRIRDAREAINQCIDCLRKRSPEGPAIFEYLRAQLM